MAQMTQARQNPRHYTGSEFQTFQEWAIGVQTQLNSDPSRSNAGQPMTYGFQ